MLNLDDRLIKETLPRIKPNGLAVLLAIAIHLNKDQTCFPSQSKLRSLTGLGDESIYNALKVLKNEGLLVSSQPINSKNKTFGRRMFKVNTDLIGVFISAKNADALEEKPLTDLPDAAEPDAAEPDAANHETYLINDTLSINQSLSINNREGGAPAENQIPETSEEKNTPLPKVAPKGFAPAAAPDEEEKDAFEQWLPSLHKAMESGAHGSMPYPTHAVTTHDPAAPGIVTVDPLTIEVYDYSVSENGVMVVKTSKIPIGPIVFESKPSVAPIIAPPRRAATLLEAEKKIVAWILGDGLETVKHRHQVAKIKFEPADAESIAAHYASIYTSTSPGSKAAFMADPVSHFENGLFKYLKNEQSFSRSTPKQLQNQQTRNQNAPARSNIQHLGGEGDAKYFQ